MTSGTCVAGRDLVLLLERGLLFNLDVLRGGVSSSDEMSIMSILS